MVVRRENLSEHDSSILEVRGLAGVAVLLILRLVVVENRSEVAEGPADETTKAVGEGGCAEEVRRNFYPCLRIISVIVAHDLDPFRRFLVTRILPLPIPLHRSPKSPIPLQPSIALENIASLQTLAWWRSNLEDVVFSVAAPYEVGEIGVLHRSPKGGSRRHATIEVSLELVKGLPTDSELFRMVLVEGGFEVIIIGDREYAVGRLVCGRLVAELIVNGFSGSAVPQTALFDDALDILDIVKTEVGGCRGEYRPLSRIVSVQVEFWQFDRTSGGDIQGVTVCNVWGRDRNEGDGRPWEVLSCAMLWKMHTSGIFHVLVVVRSGKVDALVTKS